MIADDVVATELHGTEEPRVVRPTGIDLLIDVRARVVLAQGLIEDGDYGEALAVLYDLEDDLEAVMQP